MAYSKLWDEAYPPSSLPANQIHLAIQYWAIAIRERLNDAFGTADWATAVQPFQPAQINFRGATPAIRGGSASLRFRNNADTLDNITLADAGDLTARRNIISTNNLVSNNDLVFNNATARILPGATRITFRNFVDTLDNFLISDTGDATLRGTLSLPSIAVSGYIWAISGSIRFRNAANSVDNIVVDNAGNVTIVGTVAAPSFNASAGITSAGPNALNGLTTVKQLGLVLVSAGPGSGAITIDFNTGAYQLFTMNGNTTFTFTAPPINTKVWLRVKQDGAGGRTPTYPVNVIPTPVPASSVGNHSQLIEMLYDGTDYLVMTNSDHIR